MKKLLLAALLVSSSAIAAEREVYYAPKEITDHPAYSVLAAVGEDVVYADGHPIPLSDYIDVITEDSPELVKYCMQKVLNARVVIAHVDDDEVDEVVGTIVPLMQTPHHMKVDTERLIRDIYREELTGHNYDFGKPADIKKYLKKEMKYCLINKF